MQDSLSTLRITSIVNRLASITVSVDPDQPPALLSDTMEPSAPTRWRIYNVRFAEDYQGAIAIEGSAHQIQTKQWIRDLQIRLLLRERRSSPTDV